MAPASHRMQVVDDLYFLRQDNANLLKEVNTLRAQSDLLRERSDELEKKLRGYMDGERQAQRQDTSLQANRTIKREVPEIHLDIPFHHHTQSQATAMAPPREDLDAPAVWFDDPPIQEPPQNRLLDRLKLDDARPSTNGSQLIGEAPTRRATPNPDVDAESNRLSSVAPPSPDPSEDTSRPLPSLLSVMAPVSGVALPDVASSLLELRLIRKETYDSPAAVASFLQKITQTSHSPHPTYRMAFTAAFSALIPLLGPPGTLPTEWLSFLHDFPSRIPHTQRDSIVSIPWPVSTISIGGVLAAVPPQRPPRSSERPNSRRRSRSLDGSVPRRPPVPNVPPPPVPHPPDQRVPIPSTGLPPCERDAWVLLLALAYAAFPFSRVTTKLRRLPVTIKLQMIAWLPPGVNVYSNMHFVSTTVDEALLQFWDSKKEILRLKHGWP